MTPDTAGQFACRTCGTPLNRYVNITTNEVRFTHPISAGQRPDHQPDPVPAGQVDARYVCDFCSDEKIVYTYRVRPIEVVALGANEGLVHQYGSDWAACIECAQLVDARDVDGLHARVLRCGPPLPRQATAGIRTMQQTVLASILPGRTLATIGRWPATPLPAPTLPKVRDRLAQLIRGDDDLPPHLNHPDTRRRIAAGLDAAQLYWIDAEFTDLARHAARSLPATTVSATTAPTPHGLLAWAQPVGPGDDLTAASWTCGPDGIHVVCYRSIGTGLHTTALQRLREQVGWLIPAHTTHLQPDQAVNADSPASTVIAAWLLIGQKLAETAPIPVEKTIRKAYQRGGRPAPEVRLVRIRGSAAAATTRTAHPSGNRASRDREHRWWVRGHWRNQPYGPGRTQRRLIYIDPHIRGPEGKPIKPSTTVHILGGDREPKSS
jgi:hypothetical protein